MRPETHRYIDRAFSGMDAFTPPERLPSGVAQLIDNFLMTPGGALVSRSGFQGQLSTALGGPVYFARDRYIMPDGSVRLIFACAGKLYRYTPGATSAVEIQKTGSVSFAFTSAANVRFAQWGKYVFLLDAGDTTGAIWRVDVGAGGQAVSLSALTRPTAPPVATLGLKVLNALAPADWSPDTFSNANVNLCGNPRFTGGSSGGADCGDYWAILRGAPDCQDTADNGSLPPLASGDKWLHLDNSGDVLALCKDSAGTLSYLDNGYAENSKWSSSADARRYCERFLFKCRAVKLGTDAKAFTIRIQFFSDAATPTDDVVPLYQHEITVLPSVIGKDELVREVIDLRGQIPSGIRYLRLFFMPNEAGASTPHGPFVTDIELQAIHPYWEVPSPLLSEAGFIPVGDDVSILEGLYLAFNASGTINASGLNRLALTLSTPATFTPLPSVYFRFKDASGNVWDSPPTVFSSAISIDITEMPEAMKAAIDRFAMVFAEDAQVSGLKVSRTPASTRCAFYINDLVEPGNLSVGTPYSYLFSDFNADDDTYAEGGIESSGSPDSERITTTTIQGRTVVTLPSGFSPAGDYFLIWRRGGVVPNSDTRPRLVAMVPVGSDASGTNWSWVSSTRTFTDNVPDTDLWFADAYLVGRDSPPLGGRCLIVHAQRLFVGVYNATTKVNNIYASWLLDGGTDAGYYFTNAPDPSDLEGQIKGGLLLERGDAGDRIQALASMIPPESQQNDPLAAHLLVLKETSPPSILTGSRGGVGVDGAFRLLPATTEKGAGCIAPQSAEFVHGVWWATASGILTLGGSRITPVSLALGSLLTLKDIGKDRYSQVFTLWHARKAFVLLPGASTADGVIYVWDEQAPQGSRWTRMSAPAGFVSGVTLSGGQDTGDVYLGGRDGQIYLYTGTSDKATPAASATGIPLALTTRKYGQDESGPVTFFAEQQAQEVQLEMETGASLTLSGTLYSDQASRAFSWAFPSGVSTALIRGLGTHRGTTHWIALTGSATTATKLKALSLRTTETSNRGR